MNKSIQAIIKPAIARPRGEKNIPIKLNRKPKNQITHPRIGIQDRNNDNIENINPATPHPFD